MQTRPLGKTGISLSIVGFGGIVVSKRPQADANDEVARAIDEGITYFDVAPAYGDAEDRLGPAIKPYRDRVALACKTGKRTAEEAQAELDQSLKKLETDHFDIYQMHAMTTKQDLEIAMGPGGAIETFEKAKQAGKVRLIGFSAHDQDTALRLVESGRFDTVLFPLNYAGYTRGGFGPRLLKHANEKGMGIMALKSLARCRVPEGGDRPYEKCWYVPEDRQEVAELQLRWTLSLTGVCAAIPPGDPSLYHMAVKFGQRFERIDDAGEAKLSGAIDQDAAPIFSNGR